MKRMIGSVAALVLALGLGVSAFARTTPKRNSGMMTRASALNSSTTRQQNEKWMRNRRHHHHHKHWRSSANRKGKDSGEGK